MTSPHCEPLNYADRSVTTPRRGPRAFRVVPAILVVLIVGAFAYSLLVPSLTICRESADRVKCAANLRQIGQAIVIYEQAYGAYPQTLADLVVLQLPHGVFRCPLGDEQELTSTELVASPHLLSHRRYCAYVYVAPEPGCADAEHVVAFEHADHNEDGANVLLGDGSVRWWASERTALLHHAHAAGVRQLRVDGVTTDDPGAANR